MTKRLPNLLILAILAGMLFINLFFDAWVLKFLSFLIFVYFFYIYLGNKEPSKKDRIDVPPLPRGGDNNPKEKKVDFPPQEKPIIEDVTRKPENPISESIPLDHIVKVIETIDENINSLPDKERLMVFLVMNIYERIQHKKGVESINERDGYDPDFHILVPMEWGIEKGTYIKVIRIGISIDGVAQLRALVKKG